MRGAIAVLSTLCKRFAAVLRYCDVESFLNIGRLFQEIAPLEKRIDMHIDLLRRNEFREMECTSDINKYSRSFLLQSYFINQSSQDSSTIQPLGGDILQRLRFRPWRAGTGSCTIVRSRLGRICILDGTYQDCCRSHPE